MSKYLGSLIAVALLVATAAAEPRTWTDRDGLQIEAEFVRVHNGRVVLTRFGKALQFPLDSLSLKDQAWIQAELAKKEVRTWRQIDGTEIRGRLVDCREGEVEIRAGSEVVSLPLADLVRTDQELVSSLLTAQGIDVELPPPPAAAPAVDQPLPAGEEEAAEGPRPAPAGADPSLDVGHLQRPRIWTDLRQRKVEATLQRVEDSSAVLLKDGAEIRVPIAMLSAADRAYIDSVGSMLATRERLEREARLRRIRERAAGAPDMLELLEQMRQRREERLAETRARIEETERRRRELAAAAEGGAPADGAEPVPAAETVPAEESPPAAAAPPVAVSNGPAAERAVERPGPPQVEGGIASRHEPRHDLPPRDASLQRWGACGQCGARLPPRIGAGDKCPNCGAYFESEVAADGSVTQVGWLSRALNGPYRAWWSGALMILCGSCLALLIHLLREAWFS